MNFLRGSRLPIPWSKIMITISSIMCAKCTSHGHRPLHHGGCIVSRKVLWSIRCSDLWITFTGSRLPISRSSRYWMSLTNARQILSDEADGECYRVWVANAKSTRTRSCLLWSDRIMFTFSWSRRGGMLMMDVHKNRPCASSGTARRGHVPIKIMFTLGNQIMFTWTMMHNKLHWKCSRSFFVYYEPRLQETARADMTDPIVNNDCTNVSRKRT